MNAAKPISPEEYKTYRSELYKIRQDASREDLAYQVKLDEDPTRIPLNISANLAKVQSYMERVVVVLNRAILAEAYWKTAAYKLESKFDSEYVRVLISAEGQAAAKNAEGREAFATVKAQETVINILFSDREAAKRPKYEDQMFHFKSNLADASAFREEVQNIYDILELASTSLAVQQKNSVYSRSVHGVGEEVPA